jgi:hypothetical protein
VITEEFGNPWMANLREIAPPEPVSMLPQAPGWYLLAGLLATGLLWLLWRAYMRWRVNAYRREALKELNAIEGASAIAALPSLLKRTALAAYPRERVASLTGDRWLSFLDGTVGAEEFSRDPGRSIATLAYSPSPEADHRKLIELARRWIRRHRVER